MPDTASSTGAPEAVALSPVERVVNTYIEPSKTFQDIKRSRSWWLPFLILVVLGYIFCFAAVQHVGWDSLVTNAMRSSPRTAAQMDKASSADLARMVAVGKGFTEGIMVATPVILLLVTAIVALVIWGCFAFGLGGITTYGEMFAVVMFASLPNALGALVNTAAVFASEPQTYNINVQSPVSLSYFLGSDAPHWLMTLGGSLDLFTIWAVVLTGFGAAIVSKVKPSRGIVAVVILWIVYVLLKTGIAAATS